MTLSGHRHISTRYIKEDDTFYFTCPSTVTWPMRYVVFEVNEEEISCNTYDVPCESEVWQEAKEFSLTRQRPPWFDTAEEFGEVIASPETMSDVIPIPASVKNAIGY